MQLRELFGQALRERAIQDGLPFFAISSVANQGTREQVAAVAAKLDETTLADKQPDAIELAL